MKWISVEEALPEEGQAVLVRRNQDNWHATHTVVSLDTANPLETRHIWRWQACYIRYGRTLEELEEGRRTLREDREAGKSIHPDDRRRFVGGSDVWGNNLLPYCWDGFGSGYLFGQDVSHWSPISDPCEEDLPHSPGVIPPDWATCECGACRERQAISEAPQDFFLTGDGSDGL